MPTTPKHDSLKAAGVKKTRSSSRLKSKAKPQVLDEDGSSRPLMMASDDSTPSKVTELLSVELDKIGRALEDDAGDETMAATAEINSTTIRRLSFGSKNPTPTSTRVTRSSCRRSLSGITLVEPECASRLDAESKGGSEQQDHASDRPEQSSRASSRPRSPRINEENASTSQQPNDSPCPPPRARRPRSNDEEATGSDRTTDSPVPSRHREDPRSNDEHSLSSDQEQDHSGSSPHSQRPRGNEDEASTGPAPGTESRPPVLTPQVIHDGMLKELKKALTDKDKANVGYVYAARDPFGNPKLIKIGFTTNWNERKNTIKGDCGLDLEVVYKKLLDHPLKAERFAQRELLTLNVRFKCPKCSRNHQEWFQVSDEKAREVVEKWAVFMETQMPYDANGKLKPLWEFLLKVYQPGLDKNFDSRRFEALWAILRSPHHMHHWEFRYCKIRAHKSWPSVWQRRWQLYSCVAWFVAFNSIRDAVTGFALLVAVVPALLHIE